MLLPIDCSVLGAQINAVRDDEAIVCLGNIALYCRGSNRNQARNASSLLTLIVDGHGATSGISGHGANIAQNNIALGKSRTLDANINTMLSAIIVTLHKIDGAEVHGIPSHDGHSLHILSSVQINIFSINPATALKQGALLRRDAHRALFCTRGHAISSILIQLSITNIAI